MSLMPRVVRLLSVAALAVAAGITTTALVQRGGTSARSTGKPQAEATARIVAAAQAVLASLDDAGRATLQFPLEGPQTTRWSNLPSPMFERRGLRLADLTQSQRVAVMKSLATALSRDGYQKVLNIMDGDEALRQGGGGRGRRAVAR